jgi:hypothetical protein
MSQSVHAGLPKPGDIVLERIGDGSRCALTTSGHVPQIMYPTYEEAVAEAGRCARDRRLDVWATGDHRTFSRIVECRPVRERVNRTRDPGNADRN